jgi:Cu+-exporting ATPase
LTIFHPSLIIRSQLNSKSKGEDEMDATLRDPVCGMDVTYETAQARTEYEGRTYYFCSVECKEAFDEEPEKYVQQEEFPH